MSNASRDHLSIREFAARTGFSESTVRRRIDDGSLPAFQLGGKGKQWRIPADALEQLRSTVGSCDSSLPNGEGHNGSVNHPSSIPARRGPKPKWQQAGVPNA